MNRLRRLQLAPRHRRRANPRTPPRPQSQARQPRSIATCPDSVSPDTTPPTTRTSDRIQSMPPGRLTIARRSGHDRPHRQHHDPDRPGLTRNQPDSHSQNPDSYGQIWTKSDKSGLSRTHSARIPSPQQQIHQTCPEFSRARPDPHSAGVRACTTYIGSLRPLAGEISCHCGASNAPE